jgi:hypothetical protein
MAICNCRVYLIILALFLHVKPANLGTETIIASLFHASAPVSVTEKIVSAAAAFLGIFLTALLSSGLGDKATPLMITSLGASSVLLFAASHSPMAQPWPFVGGQLISALVGVTCFKFIPGGFVAGSLAVALAIFAMHLSNCLHPPGGATALAMVMGGQELHQLGYSIVRPRWDSTSSSAGHRTRDQQPVSGTALSYYLRRHAKTGAPSTVIANRNALMKEDTKAR